MIPFLEKYLLSENPYLANIDTRASFNGGNFLCLVNSCENETFIARCTSKRHKKRYSEKYINGQILRFYHKGDTFRFRIYTAGGVNIAISEILDKFDIINIERPGIEKVRK